MIDEKQLRTLVRECFEDAHGPDGVQGQVPGWLYEKFSARFLGPTGTVREGCVTRTTYGTPTAEQIARINTLWTELRVSRYGEVARHPTPQRRFWLPSLVLEILNK